MENTHSEKVSATGSNFSTYTGRPGVALIGGSAGSTANNLITLEHITDPANFQFLKEDWNQLALELNASEGPARNFDWILKAFKFQHLKDRTAELSVVVGRHNRQVVMIWPLMRSYLGGVARLELIRNSGGEYSSLLLRDHPSKPEWLQRSFAYLGSAVNWDTLSIGGVRRHTLMLSFMKDQRALCLETADGVSFNCLLARNMAGQAYNSLLQGHLYANRLYDYVRTVCSTLL